MVFWPCTGPESMASGPRLRIVKLRLSALLRPHVPSISPKRPQRKVAKVAFSVQSERIVTWPEVGKSRVVGSVVGSIGFWSGSHQRNLPKGFAVLGPGGLLGAELLHPGQPEAVLLARERQKEQMVGAAMPGLPRRRHPRCG